MRNKSIEATRVTCEKRTETGRNEIEQEKMLDSANALGNRVNHWHHDERYTKAYKSMGKENELPIK